MSIRTRKIALLLVSILACIGLVASASSALASPGPSASHRSTAVAPVSGSNVHRTFAAAATPVHGSNELARTSLILRPDSGYNPTVYWALDDMTRTLHVVLQHSVTGTDCGLAATHACYLWNYSIGDSSGKFQTLQNVDSPGFFDKNLDVAERGTFSGSQYGIVYATYKNAFPGSVPTSENDNGTLAGTSSTNWPCFMFAGAAACKPQGANTFTYNYSAPAGTDAQCPAGHWAWQDSSALGDTGPSGDILAPDKADCASTPNTTSAAIKTDALVSVSAPRAPPVAANSSDCSPYTEYCGIVDLSESYVGGHDHGVFIYGTSLSSGNAWSYAFQPEDGVWGRFISYSTGLCWNYDPETGNIAIDSCVNNANEYFWIDAHDGHYALKNYYLGTTDNIYNPGNGYDITYCDCNNNGTAFDFVT
jgi:hypothetical protein